MAHISTADLCLADVNALRSLARRFDAAAATEKAALLDLCAARLCCDPEALVAYHDTLLFMLAYPQNPALRQRCAGELARCADLARSLTGAGETVPDALHGSGLPFTRVAVSFNLKVARWLADRFAGAVRLHGARGSVTTLRRLLTETLPAAEFETLAADAEEAGDLLAALGIERTGAGLRWLLDAIASVEMPERLRVALYDDLDVFVALHSADSTLARQYLTGLERPIHYQDEPLSRSEDAARLLDMPLGPPLPLTAEDRHRLITTARGLLALLGRQTEPISSCIASGVMAYDLGRGVVIALFSTAPEDRTPFDSHVGMMLFKNGLPVAYGGGWPFLGTCKIGINIFEPYRGGESHFLFLSVLRAYRHLFGVNRFIVERYQFGRNNPEGIASAAYWFYYRLGFRSMRADLARLAEREWKKLRDGTRTATSRRTLLRFTEAHMDLRLPGCPDSYDYCDPADLSRAVTAAVIDRFAGDRRAFLAWAEDRVRRLIGWQERLPARGAAALALLAPAVALIPDLESWPEADLQSLQAWLLARVADDEQPYFALLAQCPRLQRALESVAGVTV
jgi:hypothetical protein